MKFTDLCVMSTLPVFLQIARTLGGGRGEGKIPRIRSKFQEFLGIPGACRNPVEGIKIK